MNDDRLIKVPLYSQREEVADDIGVNTGDVARLTGIAKSSVSYYFSGEWQVRTEHLFEFLISDNWSIT